MEKNKKNIFLKHLVLFTQDDGFEIYKQEKSKKQIIYNDEKKSKSSSMGKIKPKRRWVPITLDGQLYLYTRSPAFHERKQHGQFFIWIQCILLKWRLIYVELWRLLFMSLNSFDILSWLPEVPWVGKAAVPFGQLFQ